MRLIRCAWLLLVLASCRTMAPSLSESTHQGYLVFRRFTGGAGPDAPLIVALHGRGGSPQRMAEKWDGFNGRAELALPRGPEPSENGWCWYDPPNGDKAHFAKSVSDAEQKLWPAIAEVAHGRPIIVMGFSQGAVMTYLIAARHPAEVVAAFPVAGMLPEGLLPREHRPAAPIHAMHGDADPRVPVALGQATVDAFVRDGAEATMHVFPGAPHEVTPQMREELWREVAAAVDRPARSP